MIDRKLSKKELCMIELYIENLNKNHGLSDKTMKANVLCMPRCV